VGCLFAAVDSTYAISTLWVPCLSQMKLFERAVLWHFLLFMYLWRSWTHIHSFWHALHVLLRGMEVFKNSTVTGLRWWTCGTCRNKLEMICNANKTNDPARAEVFCRLCIQTLNLHCPRELLWLFANRCVCKTVKLEEHSIVRWLLLQEIYLKISFVLT